MKRRTFLQRFGPLVAAMGLSQAEWLSLGSHYYQALAQPSPRKFALLIGINEYSQYSPLAGCVMDVELQRELLIHRFGFFDSQILALTDEQAGREYVEQAFQEHLVQQARPGDVVVFHFSGYGCRIESEVLQPKLNNALVTPSSTGKVQDYLLENTLQLLLRSLATNRVTVVLDTSYYTPATLLPSGWLIRACNPPAEASVADAERQLQSNLRNQLAAKNLLAANLPVTVLTPTDDNNKAARELLFTDCSTGLFTYALTQYLWETVPATTIHISLSQVSNSTYKLGSYQQPQIFGTKTHQQQIADNFLPPLTMGAEGVVQNVQEDGKTVRLWLGGIPGHILPYYDVNSQFSLLGEEEDKTKLILRSRTGLTGKAQVSSDDTLFIPKVGQLIQEAIRVIPRDIELTMALGSNLERIERVDATSALSALSNVTSVIAGEQPADYVFGKLPMAKTSEKESSTLMMTAPSRYGLFSLASDSIPNTVGEVGEVVKLAVKRLAPKIRTMQAAKLWRLTENAASSRLALKVNLEIVSGIVPRIITQRQTVRTISTISPGKKTVSADSGKLPIIPIGSRIQYRIQNIGSRPIYLMLLGLDTSMNAYALYPWQNPDNDGSTENKPLLQDITIAAGKTLLVPLPNTGFQWLIAGPAFFAETQLIFSTAPFTQTLEQQAAKHHGSIQQQIAPLLNPVEVAQALLQDLHNASTQPSSSNTTTDFYSLNVNNWASFSFIYQVV
ncbi:caspase family protein [Calothrix rhizosoleniae]|uniref:caspase family protein n=1 Tax=Calothrix rhizosoleniae TaxID=888997 RepID=UPI000B49EF30|nr:caspase family protein [Calothrix rhizosoleniae]